ncbi:hypothetical protein PG993_013520 [Apiospora rasikravindrae]|uniref:SAP domain-containing protein n=1 Tax=Apiospora rasikravindrae TaxID=990691 RepID=A0ABR1RY16_9PEZI
MSASHTIPQDRMNLDASSRTGDLPRQLAYVLARMAQRHDENEQVHPSNIESQSTLSGWLSHYLNDKNLPPPTTAAGLPKPPTPQFSDIPSGAPLNQIEQILLDDASDLQGYRYYMLKPFRDKLIESWDKYYPWLQAWRERVRVAATDAQARGLLADTHELMQRLRRRDPSLSDISKCKISYETGFGKEYFIFTGMESHIETQAADEDVPNRDVNDSDSSSTLSDTKADSEDVIDLTCMNDREQDGDGSIMESDVEHKPEHQAQEVLYDWQRTPDPLDVIEDPELSYGQPASKYKALKDTPSVPANRRYQSWATKSLATACRLRNLDGNGSKWELIGRLREADADDDERAEYHGSTEKPAYLLPTCRECVRADTPCDYAFVEGKGPRSKIVKWEKIKAKKRKRAPK